MTEDQKRERRVQEAIERGRAIVRESRALVERSRRQFAEMGIDPEAEYDKLMQSGGEEAVAKAQAEVQHLLDGIDDEMRRDAMHGRSLALVPLRRRFNRV